MTPLSSLLVTAALPILAGCASFGSPASDVTPTQRAFTWMKPNAEKGPLLYVSDAGTNDVVVYRYTSGIEAGVLTGFDDPQGECVDEAGDVWIANSRGANLLEYAHGGTTAIATLQDRGQYPVGCSIDAKTGTLAVSNIAARRGHDRRGSVSLYAHASGVPTVIKSPGFGEVFFLAYDDRGNLFLDGYNDSDEFAFGELAAGSSSIEPIALSGAAVRFPGGVQFDNGKVNIGDQAGAIIYQATQAGTITGSTPLEGSSDCVDFFIRAKAVVCPDAGNGDVEVYAFPAGGEPVRITSGLVAPTGAAVSR